MNGSLFLSPEQPDSAFEDVTLLKNSLLELGLIIDGIGGNHADSYLCGENFTRLITFMGCSPHLVFEKPMDGSDKYCHIKFYHHEAIRVLTGKQTAPPRCPSCRTRFTDWRNLLNHQKNGMTVEKWHCPKCGNDAMPYAFDWRQSGGAGRVFIEIKNIFPGEAVPVDQLMNHLKEISGEPWRYFYLV